MSRLKLLPIRKWVLLGLPVLLILLLSGSVYWLLHTATGAAWMWNKLEQQTAIDVRASQVTGSLASGFVARDLEYRSESLDLLIRHAEIEAGIGWWPLSIKVGSLSLQDVDVLTRSSGLAGESAGEDADIRSMLEALKPPVPVVLDNVALTNVTIREDDSPPVTLFESVRFQAALDERLVVDYLDVLATGLETRLEGHLNLEAPFDLVALAQGNFEISGEADQSVLEIPFILESSGNLQQLQLSLASEKFGLQLDGEIVEPVSSLSWDIKAVLDRLDWPEASAEKVFALSDLKLASSGNLGDWSFELDAGLQADQLHDARIAIKGAGSATGVEITDANLTGPGVDLDFNGGLDWSTEAAVGLKAVIRQLDLSPWLSAWPDGGSLAGNLELNWSGNGLTIPASHLTMTGTGLEVNAEADIDLDTNIVNAGLEWRNLNWPLNNATADFSSESGWLKLTGSADDWLASGQLNVRVGDYPQGRFDINGGGNRTSTHLVIPAGEILGGTLSGSVDADWSAGLAWNTAIQAQSVNPEPLLPGWSGRLDTEVEISAQSEPDQMHINLIALQGVLREVSLSARGGLLVDGADLAFESLEILTDEAILKLDGAMVDPAGASVKFSGSLPSRLLRGARGKLELDGRYSSHTSQPLFEVQLQALDLAWDGLSVKTLAVSTPETRTSESLPKLQVDATGVSWEDQLVDELSLTLSPVGDRLELTASLLGEKFILNSGVSLVPENMDDPFGGSWQGQLAVLDWEIGPAYRFELTEESAFAWSPDAAFIEPVCLSENKGGSMCVGLDYKSNGDWSLLADARSVPFDYLRDILELDIHFEQLLEGHMEWHQPHDGPPTGGGDFLITAGRILDALDDEVLTQSNEGRFAFRLQNGNLESGVIDIEFPGTGFIDVDFDVIDIVVDGEQEVQGRAIAQLDHLNFLGQIAIPGVDAIDGQFESDIKLGGTLSDPEFDGAFKVSNGFINYAPIGLQLEEIGIEGRVTENDRGSFKGRFRAGEGIASFDGGFLFDSLESVKLEVDLAGKQLLLVNTDMLKILTETDLKIGLGPERMDINGQVTVPSASLTPANLLFGEVRDSDDLVIDTPQGLAEPVVTEAPAKRQVYGQLTVAFGDDVLINLPGIETRISGSTKYNWSGDTIPMADGVYTLKGNVNVYGPMLRVRNGSISFPGVPADNPILNIRAGRDIYGNTQIRRAGVQLIGTLKRPVLEAYTVPITSEDRAWALLVTGTDFDQGQGVNGFDVGTYIAPKLYVSYGISLFEDENVVSARYDLKKGFGIKVTSGQRETGLDISYTIDK